MTKIIKKENIKIEELKDLKDEGIRPILLGNFTEEEKQEYYALGIYDIASTEEEANSKIQEATNYDEIKILDKNEVKEQIVEKDVKISKPGIFTSPIKTTIAGLSVFAILGASMFAFGYSNNILSGGKLNIVSNQKKNETVEKINIENSNTTALPAIVEVADIAEPEPEQTPKVEQKELGGSIPTPQYTIEETPSNNPEDNTTQTVIIPTEDVTGTVEGEKAIEENPLLNKEETSIGDRVVSTPEPVENPENQSVPAPLPTPAPAPENPPEISEENSEETTEPETATEPEIVVDENGDYTIVW